MPTTIHLVRHAHTGALGRVLAGRQPGWPLNEIGKQQAKGLAEILAAVPLRAVISAPLPRCRETAAAIAARHRLGVTIEEGFDEIDFGAWAGKTFPELNDDPQWIAWNRHRGLATPPGGESMVLAQGRALSALAALPDLWPNAEIAVVSHADVIKSMVLGLLGAPLDLMHRMVIHPASRCIVRLHPNDSEVLAVNLPLPV